MANRILAAFLALPMLIAGGTAVASPGSAHRDASIPFVNHGGIRDWRADGSHGIYVQDQQRNWYYARLMGPCTDLSYVDRIGFETRGADTLDKFGALVVRGQHCQIEQFTRSGAPPAKAKKG